MPIGEHEAMKIFFFEFLGRLICRSLIGPRDRDLREDRDAEQLGKASAGWG